MQPDLAAKITKYSVLLHNFVCDRDGFAIEDVMTIIGLEDQRDRGTVSEMVCLIILCHLLVLYHGR